MTIRLTVGLIVSVLLTGAAACSQDAPAPTQNAEARGRGAQAPARGRPARGRANQAPAARGAQAAPASASDAPTPATTEKPAAAAQPNSPAAAATAASGSQPQAPATAAAATPAPAPVAPPVAAQASPSNSTTAAAPGADPTPGQPPVEPAGFTYNPEGRRDPFVSLVRRGTTTTRGSGPGAARPSGLAGLETAEITLRGILRSRDGFVAMLQGADQKTYIVRAGDKLFDGTVRTISLNDMVILQQVNDPLSLEKQREVRKVIRQAEAN